MAREDQKEKRFLPQKFEELMLHILAKNTVARNPTDILGFFYFVWFLLLTLYYYPLCSIYSPMRVCEYKQI